jgi:hypothetical protein
MTSIDPVGQQLIIVFHLPTPFEPIQIHLPTLEIAKPTDTNDPTTTAFTDSWIKNMVIKLFRKIDLAIEEHEINNDQCLDQLKEIIEYPNPSKKTFEHYLQLSVLLPTSYLVELYNNQVLQQFRDFYTNEPSNRILILHLHMVGKARRLLKQLFPSRLDSSATVSENTINSVRPISTPIQQVHAPNSISPSPLTVSEDIENIDDEHETTRELEEKSTNDKHVQFNETETVHPAFRSLNGVPDSFTPTHFIHRDSAGNPTTTKCNIRQRLPVHIDRKRLSQNMQPKLHWESYERNNNYIKSKEDYVDQYNLENPYPPQAIYSNVSSWTRARFNPDNADLVIDPNTGLFLPWRAERSSTGRMIDCFPVQLNDVFMIREVYLSTFCGGPSTVGYVQFNQKTIKHFTDAFPCLGSNDVTKFLHWHNELVDFCSCYGIYCPPAHMFHSTRATLRSTSHTHNNTYYDRKQHDNKRVDKAQTTIKLELCEFLESELFYEVESLPRGSSDVY